MAVNIYDTANQLEKEIRETEQFVTLQEAFKAVQNDEVASEIFNEFRTVQQNLQQKQMTGQEITEEEAQQAQEISGKIGENETISGLLEAEKQVGQMIDDINQVVLKPVRELYQ
ncbi:YlbF family regulator [Marinilactibacillus kalidii]|uniref:YlbF family regulator n=1 Tax=Marinilactibacillus kalidii TaxID=2820274 RepID=UPI001ABDF7D5|nr:YlbF family regulator [Marinilactibacillus kalidii]